jgi:hypothetical protein
MSHALILTLGLLMAAPRAVPDKEFDQALDRFRAAVRSDVLDERVSALDDLVDLANLNATAPIVAEYGQIAERLYEKESRVAKLEYALERRHIIVENLEAVVARDEGSRGRLETEQEKLAEIEEDLAKASEQVGLLAPWRDALAGGLGVLYELVGESKRRKVEEVIWDDAEEHPEHLIRLASVELLGALGGPGTALRLQKLMTEWSKENAGDQKVLAEEMGRVRKTEKLLQDEGARTGGRLSNASMAEYNRVKKEAGQLQRRIVRRERLIDSAAAAGASALSREVDKQLDKSIASLVRALKKSKDRARLNVLLLLSRADSDAVRTRARQLLLEEKEALARGELIDSLTAMGDTQLVPLLLERFLIEDDNWLVRSKSARALGEFRVKAAIPVLIERMGIEEGRMRTDLEHALISLTGQNFRGKEEIWQRWWDDNGADFEVVDKPEEKSTIEKARESRGSSSVSFFGVVTESHKVLFVLDVSGSMEFSMTPGNNPTDDPGLPYDMPADDEISRLTAAKRDLVKALGGLQEGALFNVVFYASDVWTWADGLVEMSADARDEVSTFVDETGAVGATNIYGALERALDLAGASEDGDWADPEIDTIYVLTDGRATVGLTTDTDDILAFVRDRNRTAGITINTIGLSAAHDTNLLRRLAEENGGTYVGR